VIRTEVLERVLRAGAPPPGGQPEEHCELCSVALPEDHRHLLDLESEGALVCACTACSMLFERPEATLGRYRAVPRLRPRRLEAPPPVEIPVGLAFFTKTGGRVVAHYPSPAGATRWDLDVERWEGFERSHLAVAAMATEVEAVLVNTARGADHCWLVPVDDCYRLVALIKREWRGLSGGPEVWKAVDRFFAGLGGRSGPERGGTAPAGGVPEDDEEKRARSESRE
jgi:Family of unknown function (DUF5947)